MLSDARIRVRGLRVHWREGGTGPPVVLVHGIGVSGTYLLPTAERLVGAARVLVPDLPGAGRSDRPRRALGVAGLASALAAWLDAIRLDRATFLGNSMGCQVLLRLATADPARVERLVLVGPTVDAGARGFARQALRLGVDALREPRPLIAIVAHDYAVYGPLRFLATARSALRDRPEERAPGVQAPALVVRGERDALVSQAWAERLTALLPRGRLVVVPRAPHALNYAAPEELAVAVVDFLSDRSAGASA